MAYDRTLWCEPLYLPLQHTYQSIAVIVGIYKATYLQYITIAKILTHTSILAIWVKSGSDPDCYPDHWVIRVSSGDLVSMLAQQAVQHCHYFCFSFGLLLMELYVVFLVEVYSAFLALSSPLLFCSSSRHCFFSALSIFALHFQE